MAFLWGRLCVSFTGVHRLCCDDSNHNIFSFFSSPDEDNKGVSDGEVYDAEEDLSAQDLIDFSPVYRCLHIYTVLRSRDIFDNYYRQQRKQQARLVLQPPTNMVSTINRTNSLGAELLRTQIEANPAQTYQS